MVREAETLQVWGTVVSVFEVNQNQNQLDPRLAVHILKTIFQYFYHLVFRIHRFIRCVMFHNLLQYFPQHLLLGQLIFEYIYISFIFYHCQQVFCTLRVSSLLSPLQDASDDIVDDEGSFQFSPEAGFVSLSYVYITLATNNEAESSCFAQLPQP